MTITFDAIYENGVLRPFQPLGLKEQAQVRVTIEPQGEFESRSNPLEPLTPSLAERIVALAHALPPGTLDALPDDLAAQHDHYLYGTPKHPG